MLATPVAATLKSAFPQAHIVYCTHPSLFELLKLCKYVDELAESGKQLNVLSQRRLISSHKADLVVDLSGSSRSHMLTFLMNAQVVHYKKQSRDAAKIQHAVENFLQTLDPLGLTLPAELFPTIVIPTQLTESVRTRVYGASPQLPLIALVPGVGNLRSHRAWIEDGWIYLIADILDTHRYIPVLVGGPDERALCERIAAATQRGCVNLAGELSLPETASLLKLSQVVVSGDTGPAHIAVAAGTPVIGLYGPTFPQRSGPYGCERLVLDASARCQCHHVKQCQLTHVPGPGECMRQLMLSDIWIKLKEVLPDLQPAST